MENINILSFSQIILQSKPTAKAVIRGNNMSTRLYGTVYFYPAGNGTLVAAEVVGLPRVMTEDQAKQAGPFYAFHVHEGRDCGSDSGENPFPDSGGHYNPTNKTHPEHAGDMPQLLSDKGYAYSSFFTSRYKPEDVVGRTVVIHQHSDDFHTQPSGNPGKKIGCGSIVPMEEQ